MGTRSRSKVANFYTLVVHTFGILLQNFYRPRIETSRFSFASENPDFDSSCVADILDETSSILSLTNGNKPKICIESKFERVTHCLRHPELFGIKVETLTIFETSDHK